MRDGLDKPALLGADTGGNHAADSLQSGTVLMSLDKT